MVTTSSDQRGGSYNETTTCRVNSCKFRGKNVTRFIPVQRFHVVTTFLEQIHALTPEHAPATPDETIAKSDPQVRSCATLYVETTSIKLRATNTLHEQQMCSHLRMPSWKGRQAWKQQRPTGINTKSGASLFLSPCPRTQQQHCNINLPQYCRLSTVSGLLPSKLRRQIFAEALT